ncbi:hypothetical protein ABF176_001868 [Flavobacterium psychrophilum]|uniref:Lipoprotein n=1 Tax=Flavobacterium psychrophilum TaxID=96345 RepID=A0A7U2RAA0_FLAPS|nr:DUF6252 family protein [Flavobacterium psychrophilum]EKT4499498.1 hypothetical protein [Flavobacterium psychrophilum]EKT4552509.1 hypothetical protein [Flavobacterium psychrophilum]ELI6453996.1 hypothetical protein [Flavobacterium psychrophilum]ELM3643170.1 hypothetical protein [Flavobacterium psychrophilum]ELM3651101.1 hypothetical protein [Flavobacterium psychrophilum]
MKNLILLLTLTLTLSCCNKDDKPFPGKGQLPAETQTGANTVGCLINGDVYLPSQSGINSPVNCQYEYINNEFFFIMSFSDDKNSGPNISVQTLRINLSQGETYLLNKNSIDDGDFTGGGGAYRLSSIKKYYTNTIKTGELKITRVDLSNSIISGTFWFDAINSAGETVQIRSGRFDWNY